MVIDSAGIHAPGGIPEVFDPEERSLLAACRREDPEALRRLVDTQYEPLYRFLWRLTASPETAAELTQEAFIRALERLDSFDGRARFSTWLHAIALNVWRDSRRRQARQIEAAEAQARTAAVPIDSEQEALARLERHEVRRAVEQLPEAQRVAILLFFYQEMSYQEIAGICNCPVGTVGSWIHHGVRALRRMLGEEGAAVGKCASKNRLPRHETRDAKEQT
jgi:RNA polymerase sigma-70 factor, ECF subfamily